MGIIYNFARRHMRRKRPTGLASSPLSSERFSIRANEHRIRYGVTLFIGGKLLGKCNSLFVEIR